MAMGGERTRPSFDVSVRLRVCRPVFDVLGVCVYVGYVACSLLWSSSPESPVLLWENFSFHGVVFVGVAEVFVFSHVCANLDSGTGILNDTATAGYCSCSTSLWEFAMLCCQ